MARIFILSLQSEWQIAKEGTLLRVLIFFTMDANTDFDLEEIRREIAARRPVSLWDYIPGHYKHFFLSSIDTRVALRLSRSLLAIIGNKFIFTFEFISSQGLAQ